MCLSFVWRGTSDDQFSISKWTTGLLLDSVGHGVLDPLLVVVLLLVTTVFHVQFFQIPRLTAPSFPHIVINLLRPTKFAVFFHQ